MGNEKYRICAYSVLALDVWYRSVVAFAILNGKVALRSWFCGVARMPSLTFWSIDC